MSRFRSLQEANRDLCGQHPPKPDTRPFNIRAAQRAAELSSTLKAAGWRVTSWQPARGHPGVKVTGELGANFDVDSYGYFDHPYQLRHKDTGEQIFAYEPYDLAADRLKGLAKLTEEGWKVAVLSQMALHFPGWTTAVWIWRDQHTYPWQFTGLSDVLGASQSNG